jgi:hypothetical protein
METLPSNISSISGGNLRMRHDELLTVSGQDELLVEETSASEASEGDFARFRRFAGAMVLSPMSAI